MCRLQQIKTVLSYMPGGEYRIVSCWDWIRLWGENIVSIQYLARSGTSKFKSPLCHGSLPDDFGLVTTLSAWPRADNHIGLLWKKRTENNVNCFGFTLGRKAGYKWCKDINKQTVLLFWDGYLKTDKLMALTTLRVSHEVNNTCSHLVIWGNICWIKCFACYETGGCMHLVLLCVNSHIMPASL